MTLGLWLLGCQRSDADLRISASPTSGPFPLEVTFEAPSADGSFTWDFGDGQTRIGDRAVHTYVGAGSFEATLAHRGRSASVQIEVTRPECPETDPPEVWGVVSDPELDELSGMAASLVEEGLFWVHQDRDHNPVLFGMDPEGRILSSHEIDGLEDFEDLASARDPLTGDPLLFVGDIGDNDRERDEVAVLVIDEPDPRVDSQPSGLRMALRYPKEPYNAETLLVDPKTLDVYLVTKDKDGESRVFLKRAPHRDPGPHVLEEVSELSFAGGDLSGLTTTGGGVSPDGGRVVIRTYLPTAYLWIRDGYLPLEAAFDGPPCQLELATEPQGEALAFTADGAGVLTVSEGEGPLVFHVGFAPP